MNKISSRFVWEISKIEPIRRSLERREVERWLIGGKTGPTPHAVKQANLRYLARQFGAKVLVETGTCRGDMLWAMKDDFTCLISVELSPALCDYSRKRCSAFSHIEIRQGDSTQELRAICSQLSGRILFWLDGHYSGGDTALGNNVSPIISELECIRECSAIDPVLVIDDARLFKPGTGYPRLEEIFELLGTWQNAMNVSVHDDGIVAIPNKIMRITQQSSDATIAAS